MDDEGELLHLQSSFGAKIGECGCLDCVQEVFDILPARYGVSARQVKERLLGLKRNSHNPVTDVALKIRQLGKVVYPSMPVSEREQLAADY